MKITITEQIKDVKMVYEIEGNKEDVVSSVFDLGFKDRWEDGDYGKVAEHAVLASEEVCRGVADALKPDELPEYLEGVDLSVIPDDWEEVWITQDSNDDIIAYNNRPVISTKGTWWKTDNYNDLWTRVERSGNSYSDVVNTTWKDSLYRYR